jgi:hypothetical protein
MVYYSIQHTETHVIKDLNLHSNKRRTRGSKMDRVKVLGLIVGIIGLGILCFFMIVWNLPSMYDEQNYQRWETNLFATAEILWSISFTLGASAMTFYTEKKAVYFMMLSTIIGAVGFVPFLERSYRLNDYQLAGPLFFIATITIVPMLISTILLALPTKQQS